MQANGGSGKSNSEAAEQEEYVHNEKPDSEEHADDGDDHPEENMEGDFTKFTGRKKKLWELRMKMVSPCHYVNWILKYKTVPSYFFIDSTLNFYLE